MNGQEKDAASEGDVYANSFYYFMRDLKLLSEDPKKQCEIKQYDNVAWELKNFFIRSAEGILNIPGGNLSAQQKDSILRLLGDVSAIPDAVINIAGSNSGDEHLRAVGHSCWPPIRAQAKELINILASETKRTNAILGIEDV